MHAHELLPFAGVLFGLAAVPSASVALVVGRTLQGGVGTGLAVIIGILCGDLVFILLALAGVHWLIQWAGPLFAGIRIVAGLGLIGYGLLLLFGTKQPDEANNPTLHAPRTGSSFLAGLLLTLADIKAVLFYAALLPALVPVHSVSMEEQLCVLSVAVVAVGSAKLMYLLGALRLRRNRAFRLSPGRARRATGGLAVGGGTYLLATV